MTFLIDGGLVAALALATPAFATRQVQPPPTSAHYVIRVLDGRTREPVANAEVRWVTFHDRDPWFGTWEAVIAARDAEESAIAASDRVAMTDSTGSVTIPLEGSRILVHAKAGSLFGTETCSAENSRDVPLDLLLWPDFDVTVRVVDRSGVAADRVPMALQSFDGHHVQRELTRTTDERGLATFRHVGQQMEKLHADRLAWGQADKSWEVRLDICLESVVFTPVGSVVSAPVKLDAPPKATVDLVLPESGSVVVEGIDAHGNRVDLGGDGCLTTRSRFVADDGVFRRWSSYRHRSGRPNFAAPGAFDGGRLRFRRVGLGLDLVALVSRNDASNLVRVDGAGPRRANEEVTLRVTVGTAGLVLHGRVVDDRSEPIVDAQLSAWRDLVSDPDVLGPEVSYLELGSLTTDRLGRFAIDLEPFEPRFQRATSLVLTRSRNLPDAREGIVELPQPPLRGDVDVGDVQLTLAPIAASGKVVDEFDAPVSRCRIEGPTWKTMDSGVNTMSDEQGRFTLRGILLDKKLELKFRAPLRPSRYLQDVTPGRRDLVIRMPRSGGLKTRIRLPSGLVGTSVSFALHHQDDGSDGADDNIYGHLEQDGRIFVDGRWPGPWNLVVSSDERELLRKSDIVIRGGEIVDLGELSLEGATSNR
jgi:hypothetical protein